MSNVNALPRSLDVRINLTRPQVELATDMTMICFLTMGEGSGVKYYSSLAAVEADGFNGTTGAYKAAIAFFSRSDRPARMAIGIIEEEEDLVDAASRIRQLSIGQGYPIYCWTIDDALRDTAGAKELADWVEGQTAWFSACTNDVQTLSASDDASFAAYVHDKGYRRTSVIYHDNLSEYPEVSYAACALSVDYSGADTALTMKFKELPGMTPSNLTETQLSALSAKNCNAYVLIGNSSRCVREGVQSADTWFTDALVNLDNFVEELQTEVFNVFLRNVKIPYSSAGQTKLISAASKICAKYERNGVFAPRDIEAPGTESGYVTAPATSIRPLPLWTATAGMKAERTSPPIELICYEAGAIHRITINITDFA